MSFLSTMNIIGSGITAQHLRLDVISENVTNISTTRTEEGGPYRRKVVVFQAQEGDRNAFRQAMARAQFNRRGLVSNAGIAYLVFFRKKESVKSGALLVLALFAAGVITGYIANAIELFIPILH